MIYLCALIGCAALALIGYCVWAIWDGGAEMRAIQARKNIGFGSRH